MGRLRTLEKQREILKQQIAASKRLQPATALPNIIPGLIDRYRTLVEQIGTLGKNWYATTDDVQNARSA